MRTSSHAAAMALLLVGCSSDSHPTLVPLPSAVNAAAAIEIVSGNGQEGKAGEPLAQPLVIRVTDATGRALADVPVSFEVSGAGGLNGKEAPGLIRVSTRTDANGRADVILEPYEVGPISVRAHVPETDVGAVTFAADATVLVIEFRSPQSFGAYAAFWGPCRCTRTLNTASVPVGTAVEWAAFDAAPYTITSTAVPAGGAAFDSGPLTTTARFRFTPTVAGTWEYRDTVSGLTATLTAAVR